MTYRYLYRLTPDDAAAADIPHVLVITPTDEMAAAMAGNYFRAFFPAGTIECISKGPHEGTCESSYPVLYRQDTFERAVPRDADDDSRWTHVYGEWGLRALLVLSVATALTLVACGGSDRATGPTDACAQSISDAYANYGTPTNRVENGAETDLFWGHTKREYIRHSDGSCFVSDPIAT